MSFATVILPVELSRPEASFDVDLAPLREVLAAGFCQIPEGDDVMPFHPFLLLPLLVVKDSSVATENSVKA